MMIPAVLITLALTLGCQAASVTNVLSDIATVKTDFTELNNNFNTWRKAGGGLFQALALQMDVTTLKGSLERATTDTINITPLPLSQSDAQAMLRAVTEIQPAILDALGEIVDNKESLKTLPHTGIPNVIKSDLMALNTAAQAFEAALVAKAPANLQASATSLKDTINAAFATAIAAYS